jgi:phosphatidylserine/phosphatidylglycerophosphate/cardiolipin synthase-like enzyme
MGNWFMDHKLPLIPGDPNSSVKELLTAAAANGVQSTVLLWQGTSNGHATNGKSSWFINHNLQNPNGQRVGFSIMDGEYPARGSHHQKFLVVNGARGAVAFCGGIDYRLNRLDDDKHLALEGYHDTHAKVEGPAVADLHKTFTERWNHHPDVTKSGSKHPTLTDLPSNLPTAGNQFVQVTHTYAPRYHYQFRPAGELGTLNTLRRAIQRAKRFIYFEDQYATPYNSDKIDGSDDTLGILTDLLAALDRIEFLLIVLPNHAEAPFNRRFRYQFIRALRHKGGNKVRIFYPARPGYVPFGTASEPDEDPNETEFAMLSQGTDLKAQGGSGGKKYRDEIFVHSKIWVVDDVYAKIGTANVNRRSTTFDTEVDLHIIDGALDRGARSFALGFRVQCWAEHLRLSGAAIAGLDDPVFALNYWDNLVGGRIKRYDEESEGGKGDLFGKRATFNNVVDPDGR